MIPGRQPRRVDVLAHIEKHDALRFASENPEVRRAAYVEAFLAVGRKDERAKLHEIIASLEAVIATAQAVAAVPKSGVHNVVSVLASSPVHLLAERDARIRAESALDIARLTGALDELLEEAESMIGYVPEYFREKWKFDECIVHAKQALLTGEPVLTTPTPAQPAETQRPQMIHLSVQDIADRQSALHASVNGRSLDELRDQDHNYELDQDEQATLRQLEGLEFLSGGSEA
jgi:hypothetical protein